MAFANTIKVKFPIGGGWYIVFGTFTDAAFAGSDIVTGLSKVEFCIAGATTAVAIGCTESATAGTITIKATNDGTDDGYWVAFGR